MFRARASWFVVMVVRVVVINVVALVAVAGYAFIVVSPALTALLVVAVAIACQN